jgi:hypothetical protein
MHSRCAAALASATVLQVHPQPGSMFLGLLKTAETISQLQRCIALQTLITTDCRATQQNRTANMHTLGWWHLK